MLFSKTRTIFGSCKSLVKSVRLFTSESAAKPYDSGLLETFRGENRAARMELAAAYRGLNLLGLNEGVCNHLSAMAPGIEAGDPTMLVINHSLHWREVTSGNLIGIAPNDGSTMEMEGTGRPEVTASCIHLGVRRRRPDATVVMHTHMPYATALACLKDPSLKMVHQNSCRFFDRIAYDVNYDGLAHGMEEGERLGDVLGSKDVLMMGNHGVLVVAPNIAMAFDQVYYLERAAMVQVLAESTGRALSLISDENAKNFSQMMWSDLQHYCDAHFYSMYRHLQKTEPDFDSVFKNNSQE